MGQQHCRPLQLLADRKPIIVAAKIKIEIEQGKKSFLVQEYRY